MTNKNILVDTIMYTGSIDEISEFIGGKFHIKNLGRNSENKSRINIIAFSSGLSVVLTEGDSLCRQWGGIYRVIKADGNYG